LERPSHLLPAGAEGRVGGSFRDPAGFVYVEAGVLYRRVHRVYREHYERLMGSGLYERLLGAGLLVAHEEAALGPDPGGTLYKVLRPELVPFVSYPYEWCFGQLRSAALATLEAQRLALEHGMVLKDASAFNVQFQRGRPVLIDTLSFELAQEGEPWVAYRQFCQHFLAPLALMARVDVRLGRLLRVHLDGVPLDLASALLPQRTWLRPSLLLHLHLHARSQKRHAAARVDRARVRRPVGRTAMLGLLDHLRGAVEALEWQPAGTEWADYAGEQSYERDGFEHKQELVAECLERIRPGVVWDLGANTGLFSRIACGLGSRVVAFDADPGAVERNHREMLARAETGLLPLVLDLMDPTPALGWQGRERMSLLERGPADAVMALALVHHLAISHNVPFEQIADFFASLAEWLLIELVPKTDPQVQRMLALREDIFADYTQEGFEAAFGRVFRLERREAIRGTPRVLYLMQRRTPRASVDPSR
jgi:hypothetical protein